MKRERHLSSASLDVGTGATPAPAGSVSGRASPTSASRLVRHHDKRALKRTGHHGMTLKAGQARATTGGVCKLKHRALTGTLRFELGGSTPLRPEGEKREQSMAPLQGIITVAGRVLLALIFLMSAAGNKIPQFTSVAQLMERQGVPMPKIMLVGAIVFLLAGSLSLVLGFKARLGAALLLVFLVLATYYFHDFWTWPVDAMWVLNTNPEAKLPVRQIEMISFMKNLALMGALLLVMANGPGPLSLDARRHAETSK